MIIIFRSILLPLALLGAMMFTAHASAEEMEWNKIVVQVDSQQADIDGDGVLETFSADVVVYPDGTAVGEIYLDSSSVVSIEEGTVVMTSNGHFDLTIEGTNQADGIHYTFNLIDELPGSANGGGGKGSGGIGDDILWDIVDSVAGTSHNFEVFTEIFIR